MRRLARSVAVLAVLLVVPRLAGACSCLASSPCRDYSAAAVVFAGEVLEVTGGAETGRPQPKIARLRVARGYKGTVEAGQVVAVEMPAGSSASCSLDVSPGARFVIFAGATGGRLTTNLCSGSHGLPPGAPWPDLPPPGGVVSGRVMRYPSDLDRSVGRVEGIAVSIATPGGPIATTTDAEGRFRLTGVPAGTWTVAVVVSGGRRLEETVDLRSADDCAELLVAVRPPRP